MRPEARKQNQVTEVLPSARFDRAALAREIQALVARLHPTVTLERRRGDRFSVPVMFRLTPLADDGRPIASESITVIGKNISRHGMSFYHAVPLPYRRARISVENIDIAFAVEIDIAWCRFSKPGWYESGGRLIAATTPEANPPGECRQNSDDRSNRPPANRRSA
jgi:hypothetical protein